MRTRSTLKDIYVSKPVGHMVDFRAWWRHPVARVFVAFLVLVLDMYLYGEDPINEAHVEANFFGLGHLYVLLMSWPSSWSLGLFRVFLIVTFGVFGAYVGRQWIHHRFLRDRLKLTMFADCKGTWFIMANTVVISLLASCFVYNLAASSSEQIGGAMGIQLRSFAKISQCCSVSADLIALTMILDSVLQDEEKYRQFLPSVKRAWRRTWGGWMRVLAAWIFLFGSAIVLSVSVIFAGKEHAVVEWDRSGAPGLDDVTRACLVCLIIFCDLFVIVQDWEFPSFSIDLQTDPILIAGTFQEKLNCDILKRLITKFPPLPTSLRRFLPPAEFFQLEVTGKWMTYGPLMGIILIDLFCMRAQVFYEPTNFGQYVDPSFRIWTITDEEFLGQVYEAGILKDGSASQISYSTRSSLPAVSESDYRLSARYIGSSFKYAAAVLGFVMIVAFFLCTWVGDRRKLLEVSSKKMASLRDHSANVFRHHRGILRRCCCCCWRSAAVAPLAYLDEGARDHEARVDTEDCDRQLKKAPECSPTGGGQAPPDTREQKAGVAPPGAGAPAPERAAVPAERTGPYG